MACLSSSCEELPTLAGWLPRGPAFMEALKWEQGSLHRAARHQVKAAQTQPYVSDSVPTGGGDKCNKLGESSDGQKENTCL